MRRVLLVAEGTFNRPLREICITALGMSITLLAGFFILNLGLSGWVTLLLIIALLLGVALLKGRYGGPREFRVERPGGSSALRLTGRFDDGEIPVKAPRELASVARDGDTLVFATRGADGREQRYHVKPPAFSTAAMDTLATMITELPSTPDDTLERRHRKRENGIKAYAARGMLLLRYSQKPNYMTLTWSTAFVVLIVWLVVAGAMVGR